jgi:ferredoxin
MSLVPKIILLILGISSFIGFFAFFITSINEKEIRAARITLLIAVLSASIFTGSAFLPLDLQLVILVLSVICLFLFLILFLLPIGKIEPDISIPTSRFDERNITFARARLIPGSQEYEMYYSLHPENKPFDDANRKLPGLLSDSSRYANPHLFASSQASFFLTESLRSRVDGEVALRQRPLSSKKTSTYLKSLATYYGALDVGITALKPYHVYSHIGRGEGTYGTPIMLEHKYAIVFTVEMDYSVVATAPTAPTVMESAKQYVESARIAIQLAAVIRALGYPARAHIDGNYRVIAPLVARDAGLGEIGRIGILITPSHGPRVRLGVVTTDIELVADIRKPDASIIDFCNICKKCATNCPSKSIPINERQKIKGVLKWQINPDTCFRYWYVAGTDCGICMRVCPYSHPDSFFHNVIRWGIKRSGSVRRVANWLDDFLYGKKPRNKHLHWTQT